MILPEKYWSQPKALGRGRHQLRQPIVNIEWTPNIVISSAGHTNRGTRVDLETFSKIGRHILLVQHQISDGDHVQHVGTDSYSSLTGKWSNIAQFLVSTEVLGERIFLVLWLYWFKRKLKRELYGKLRGNIWACFKKYLNMILRMCTKCKW